MLFKPTSFPGLVETKAAEAWSGMVLQQQTLAASVHSMRSFGSRRLGDIDEEGSPTPWWVSFCLIILISIGMYLLLKQLFKIAYMWQRKAELRMEEALAKRSTVKDNFRNENGYSWDFVFVFEVTKYTHTGAESQLKTDNSMRKLVLKMADAGLHTKMFYSVQHDEVYCKVRAPQTRLLKQAIEVNYKLLCDPINISNLLTIGNKTTPEKTWGPIRINTDGIQTEIPPYEYIYANYNPKFNTDEKKLYTKYGPVSLLRGVDRIKLIQSIISDPVSHGGCGLNIHALKEDGAILGFFPVHDEVDLAQVETKWFIFWQWPSQAPIDHVKSYFGEKIGFLTAFLAHYTSWLLWPSFFGFLTYLNVILENGDPNVFLVPFYAFAMSIWCTLFLESWKRRENRIGLEWGVYGDLQVEQVRPEFVANSKVTEVQNPVDGKPTLYFPRMEYAKRQVISTSASILFVMCVVALLIGMFSAKFVMNADDSVNEYSGHISAFLNAGIVIVMSNIYERVVRVLNEYENHRTVIEFEDSLIQKNFIVQFINTFAALFFIAFFQNYLGNDPEMPDIPRCTASCMYQISETLSVLFLTKLATSSIVSLVVPYVNMILRQREQLAGVVNKDEISLLEREFLREEYNLSMGPFTDYSEYVQQFAYVTMFVSAFPLATCMAFVSNYIQMRVRTWFFCHLARRPVPQSVNSIGTWFDILEVISYIAVLTSAGLVAFTTDFMVNARWTLRIWLFIIFSAFIMSLKWLVQVTYPRINEEINIQVARNEYILDKLFDNIPDKDDSQLKLDVKTVAKARFDIRINDDDPC